MNATIPNTFFDPSEQEEGWVGGEETRSPCRCIPSLSARRRNEVRRRRPTKAPAHSSTFVGQRPMGNSTAIAAHCVFEQLHGGSDPEHVPL